MFDVVEELPMLALILQQGRHADAHRLEIGVMDVGGDDHAPARHFVAHGFRRQALARRHVLHLFGDPALPRIVHLRADLVVRAPRNPFLSHTAFDYKPSDAREPRVASGG